jgi:phosphate-transporting ATPase
MLTVDGLHRPFLGPLSFHIDAGECLALTGPSGAGKSMLLRALVDLDPNQGRVRADGRERGAVPAPEWRRLLAYLPAESGWWLDLVGGHMPDRDAALGLLAALGFAAPEEVMSWPLSRLSSGERQRLALARGLLGKARVWLLDEPTAALDGANCALVESLLRERLNAGDAILLVSHDPAQIDRLARRRLHLVGGQLAEGS